MTFPGRKVVVWTHREGFSDEVRLGQGREEVYSVSQGARKPGAALGTRVPRPKGDPPKQTMRGLLEQCMFEGKSYLGF